jgi:hypothetical protein
MRGQLFLHFFCEVMLQSPCGKRWYRGNRNIQKVDMIDVLEYLDQNINDAEV